MKRFKIQFSIICTILAISISLISAHAFDFPTVLEDDFENAENWSLSSAAGCTMSAADGKLSIIATGNGTHNVIGNGWTISGDYIAEVKVDFTTNSTDRLPSNIGFMLKKGTDGNTYYFSGVRFPQNVSAGNNFGIAKKMNFETTTGFDLKAGFVDVSKTCYFKFIVVDNIIEVLVRYSEDDSYTSVIQYQNDALAGGTSQFGVSIWENYAHNAGIVLDKVLIYTNDCIVDSVTIGDENAALNGYMADPFVQEINVAFNTDMNVERYQEVSIYEKENENDKVDISLVSSDARTAKFAVRQRLSSGKTYVFSYGTQVTQSGIAFDRLGQLSFAVKENPITLRASVESGKLSGCASFAPGIESVTVIPAIYKDNVMLRILRPVVLTPVAANFENLDVGDVLGSTVKLYGWNEINGTAVMCEPVVVELGE